MTTTGIPAEFLRLVSLKRAAGLGGAEIRSRYALGLALWAPVPVEEQAGFMRNILAAIEATRPEGERREFEAS